MANYNGPPVTAQAFLTVDPIALGVELTQDQILSGTSQVIGTVSLTPPAVNDVFVSFTANPVNVLSFRDVTIPPGGTAPVEVVAASVANTTNVELTANVFTDTGFLTATRTVTVVTCVELLGQSNAISASQSSCPAVSYKIKAVNVKDDPLSAQEVSVEPNAETLPPRLEFYNGEIFGLQLVKVEADVATTVPSGVQVLLDLPAAQEPTELFAMPYRPYPVVLVQFSESDGTEHKFLPSLAGEALLAVTSDDGVFKVRVGVPNCRGLTVCNYTLGSTHPEFDSLIKSYSLTHGIPAQIVKAQIERESGARFNSQAYRYEPLTVDFNLFARRGTDFGNLERSLYAPWRLASSCLEPSDGWFRSSGPLLLRT